MNALANIATVNSEYKDKMIEDGVVGKIDEILGRKYLQANAYRAGIFFICNLLSTGHTTPFPKAFAFSNRS